MTRTASILIVFAFITAVHAQQPGPDPMAENLFTPDLVMRHASDIALDDRQRSTLKDALQKAQSRFVEAQFDLQGESERMVKLLRARPVDEAAVLAQADRILALEREIKRAHLALLVRVKNLLSPSQQEKLETLRRRN